MFSIKLFYDNLFKLFQVDINIYQAQLNSVIQLIIFYPLIKSSETIKQLKFNRWPRSMLETYQANF